MEFIKKHKKLIIVVIILIVLVIGAFSLYKTLSVDTSKSVYGDRLKGINKVKITEKTKDELNKDLTNFEEVESASSHVKGKIIYIYLTIKGDTPIEKTHEIANKALEHFEDDEKSFYDIQIFVNTKDESEVYPVIGYKHKTSEGFVW